MLIFLLKFYLKKKKNLHIVLFLHNKFLKLNQNHKRIHDIFHYLVQRKGRNYYHFQGN